jgi:hypothetical protein
MVMSLVMEWVLVVRMKHFASFCAGEGRLGDSGLPLELKPIIESSNKSSIYKPGTVPQTGSVE